MHLFHNMITAVSQLVKHFKPSKHAVWLGRTNLKNINNTILTITAKINQILGQQNTREREIVLLVLHLSLPDWRSTLESNILPNNNPDHLHPDKTQPLKYRMHICLQLSTDQRTAQSGHTNYCTADETTRCEAYTCACSWALTSVQPKAAMPTTIQQTRQQGVRFITQCHHHLPGRSPAGETQLGDGQRLCGQRGVGAQCEHPSGTAPVKTCGSWKPETEPQCAASHAFSV